MSVRQTPPIIRGGRWRRVWVDAVHGARRQAFVAARAQFRDNDHIGAVIEDRPELGRAVPQTRIAVDALTHFDPQCGIAPLRVAGTVLYSLRS